MTNIIITNSVQLNQNNGQLDQKHFEQNLVNKQKIECKQQQSKQRNQARYSKGSWSPQQQLRFIVFLQQNKQNFQVKQNRRKFQIFKMMEEFVKTRDHKQCRSHFQKYEINYGEIDQIIQHVLSIIREKRTIQQDFNQQQVKHEIQFSASNLIDQQNTIQWGSYASESQHFCQQTKLLIYQQHQQYKVQLLSDHYSSLLQIRIKINLESCQLSNV